MARHHKEEEVTVPQQLYRLSILQPYCHVNIFACPVMVQVEGESNRIDRIDRIDRMKRKNES